VGGHFALCTKAKVGRCGVGGQWGKSGWGCGWGSWGAIQSVGVGRGIGVPNRGVRHTGNIASAPFAREKPPPPPFGHRSRKSGGGEASPSEGLYRPVWGCRWPKASLGQSVLGGQSGGGGRRASPSLRWPVGGQWVVWPLWP